MSNKILYIFVSIVIFFGVIILIVNYLKPTVDEIIFCPADARQCPDGSYVGRTGPNCEFVCPNNETSNQLPADVKTHLDSKANLIKVSAPAPLAVITSPLKISGVAIGSWFFEASAPVVLVNWDGLIIAEGYVTAEGEWMTTNFVSFNGELKFTSPYQAGDPEFMKRGALIFKKDNPSGLPENDDALELPILFSS